MSILLLGWFALKKLIKDISSHEACAHQTTLLTSKQQAMLMPSGMREDSKDTIELGDMEGSVLEALMAFLYNCLTEIPAQLLLPLFVAADAHQVRTVLLALREGGLHLLQHLP